MTKRSKSYFNTKTSELRADGTVGGTRFNKSDKPKETTFRDLFDSLLWFKESSSKANVYSNSALENEQGAVVLASDAQAKSNAAQLSDRSLVIQPHQLPTVVNITQTAQAAPFDTMPLEALSIIPKSSLNSRNEFEVKLNESFVTWLLDKLPKPIDVSGKAALYVNGTEGDDANGDGSINKPYKTIAKAVEVVQPNQTIIVYAAIYTNAINIAKDSGDANNKFVYSIVFSPGTVIEQSTTSFYNNAGLEGLVNIFGEAEIKAMNVLGSAPLIKAETKRTSTGDTGGSSIESYIRVKSCINSFGRVLEIIGTQKSAMYINSGTMAGHNDDNVLINGTGCAISFKVSNLLSLKTTGTINLLRVQDSFGLSIDSTRFSYNSSASVNINCIKIDPGAINTNGISILYSSMYVINVIGSVNGINITGAGDLKNNVLFSNSVISGSSFTRAIAGAITDLIVVNNVISSVDAENSNGYAYGGVNGLIVDATLSSSNYYLLKPFDF